MRWKQVEDEPKTFALIFETGDEIATVLQQFARRQRLGGSSFKAIGALSHAKLGWFKWETKKYAALLSTQRQLGFASGYEYHRIMPRIETAAPAAKINGGHASRKDWAHDGAGNNVLLGFEK